MAKGQDLEIVRGLETHLKAVPWKIKISFWYGHDGASSVVWRQMWSGTQPNATALLSYSCWLFYTIKIQWIKGCEIKKCHGL